MGGGLFFFVRRIRLVLLLTGQPIPFLGHFQQRGTVLPGREVPRHEIALTRKLPILFRATRHNRGPSNRR
jgi:hypothetical protein